MTKTVYRGKFLRVKKRDGWEFVERTRANGAAVILPLTRDGKIVLVEQFRPPLHRREIALPAGLVGDEKQKEAALTAAKRELLEETGYGGGRWKFLATGPSSAGLTNEMIHFFAADGVIRCGEPNPQAGEKIEVHVVALARLMPFLRRQEKAGRRVSYKIFAALYLFEQARRA